MQIKFLFNQKLIGKMLRNPAGERNKQPILEALQRHIDVSSDRALLEISSGVGLHAAYIAPHFPKLTLQTSEIEVGMFNSIKAYRGTQKNVLDPVFIDVSEPLDQWESKFDGKPLSDCQFDYMLNINMMHITPFDCSEGLFKNASKLLKPQGLMFTYGPYAENGVLTPESNVSFDKSLRSQNPAWGIRDISDLKKIAEQNSIELSEINNLPSNNKLLVWKKQ